MCNHLDEVISPKRSTPLFESVNKLAGNNVDRNPLPVTDRAKEKANFIAKVSDGLMPIEVDILVLRYVFDETFGNIAKELKLLGAETVSRIHNEALQKLKERLK